MYVIPEKIRIGLSANPSAVKTGPSPQHSSIKRNHLYKLITYLTT